MWMAGSFVCIPSQNTVNKLVCFHSNGSITLKVLIISNNSFWSVQSLCLRNIIGIQSSHTTLSRFTALFMVILNHLYLKVSLGWWGGLSILLRCSLLVMPQQNIWICWAPSLFFRRNWRWQVKGGEGEGGIELGKKFKRAALFYYVPGI